MNKFYKYFDRQIQLFGKKKQKELQNKKIVIVGCGGLGCSIGVALGASGIGQVDLIDYDTIGIHNIHRQIGFAIKHKGKKKCKVLKKLITSRCKYVKVKTHFMNFDAFVTKNNIDYDLIIDATDNLPTRVTIDKISKIKNIPWIYGSVESFHGQVCFFDNSSFENSFNIIDHKPKGIALPSVMHIASLQANLALRYLLGLAIKKDYLYYCFFNSEGIFEIQKFKLSVN